MSTWAYTNIKGQGHLLTLVQGHSESTFSNYCFLTTAGPIEAKFHVEPPWDWGTKVCSNGPGHMTNMAVMPIMVKTLKNLLLRKHKVTLKLGMQYWVLEYYQICSNDDPGLTFTYFRVRSNLVSYAFEWEKGKTMDFSETVVVHDVKAGRCS